MNYLLMAIAVLFAAWCARSIVHDSPAVNGVKYLLLALLVVGGGRVMAQDSPVTGSEESKLDGCNDSGFYSDARFIEDICWKCFFPMKIVGVTLSASGRDDKRAPKKTAAPVCVCPGRIGYPSPGITWGMWAPTHSIELTLQPFCSPILFGKRLKNPKFDEGAGITGRALLGDHGGSTKEGVSPKSTFFYNFHWWSFPVTEMIKTLSNKACSKKSNDMDYLYLTELDPTWSNEMMALYTHPEIKLFTRIYAHAACAADAVAATVSRPIDSLFWCAGTWGMAYPFAGRGTFNTPTEAHMLAATHGLGAMHRRGLAKLYYQDKSLCADRYWFILPKQQYQFQNAWPWPNRKQAQWIGESSWAWGEWRNAPVKFEDRVIVQWTYKECCITYY
jgi:conjugal transfer pilus assembly protein TraU